MPRKSTLVPVTMAQRQSLLRRVDPTVWGLTRIGDYYDDRAEQEAGEWIEEVMRVYPSVYALVLDLGWSDAWRQRLNGYVNDRRQKLRPTLVLCLYFDLTVLVEGEPPDVHIVGEHERYLKARLGYLVHRFFEGSALRAAAAIDGIPYSDLPWYAEPGCNELEAAAANDGVLRTVVSRSRFQKLAFMDTSVREDVPAALVAIGFSEDFVLRGEGAAATSALDPERFARRRHLGDTDTNEYLRMRSERSAAAEHEASLVLPVIQKKLSNIGPWYTGDSGDLAERVAKSIGDARTRFDFAWAERGAEAVASAVTEIVESEPYGAEERRKLARYLGRALRETVPNAEDLLLENVESLPQTEVRDEQLELALTAR